ncbi:MAG: hypothetical protein CFE29_06090 [Bradyrhizobiaceae bacterium PARB1]|jgi:hypothetical protein|nr:MAG: hypothetical protein CFE29_06090 [Bradyrhizobiaceae bacterium PARB1]
MNVGTNIKSQMPGRQGATGGQRPFVIGHDSISKSLEVFKKTPFISGLHAISRDVVKDIPDIVSVPLLTTTRLDQDVPQDFVIAGRAIAESSTVVKPYPHQSVFRSADEWTAAGGDAVGLRGKQATMVPSGTGISNGKLTDSPFDARTSKPLACATNHLSPTHQTVAHQVELTSAGALSPSGGDHENHNYADI